VTSFGLSAILTRSNSIVASIARNAPQKVRIVVVRVAKFLDFQAEYEGSIPFTRSKAFQPPVKADLKNKGEHRVGCRLFVLCMSLC
jgi:hypothetical protein